MARKTPIERYRNIGISAHIDAGKTTTTERILFYTGVNHKLGEVHDGAATTDWMEQEQERGITITASAVTCFWKGMDLSYPEHRINIIDTPGYADFVSEVICGSYAADMALVVVDAVSGPEVGTDRAWGIIEKLNLPRMIVVNRMDRENADFEAVMRKLQERWGHRVMPLQIPIGAHDSFEGVVDLLHMRAYVGEKAEDLRPFEARDFARGLLGLD